MFANLRNTLLAVSVALLVGLTTGYVIGARVSGSVPDQQVVAAQREVAQSIKETSKAEVTLESEREKVRTEIQYVTKEVVKYVPKTIVRNPDPIVLADGPDASRGGDCHLSFGAVGLLNTARTGTDFQPAAYGDAQIQAATEIGLLELSQADAELAGQYRELAADHDALVAYIEQYQERLNAYGK